MKITRPDDLVLAEALLARRAAAEGGPASAEPMMESRVGLGFDVHPFADGRPLVLGGVEVPAERGLGGHSDADVLTHAVADALLGALALGDLGQHFPDSDPRYRGISSLRLLSQVADRVRAAGGRVVNVDATVIAETPRLAEWLAGMQACLAATLGLPLERVSVKAKRAEPLGALGRQEGSRRWRWPWSRCRVTRRAGRPESLGRGARLRKTRSGGHGEAQDLQHADPAEGALRPWSRARWGCMSVASPSTTSPTSATRGARSSST